MSGVRRQVRPRAGTSPAVAEPCLVRDAPPGAPGPRSSDPARLYVVATWVPRRTTVSVGSLGEVGFARGWYAYVGSARRGRDARVARHLRAEKAVRWHADHLFARFPGRRAWLVDGELSECELADALARQVAGGDPCGRPRPVRPGQRTPAASRPPRFGASDCRCAGHLLRLDRRPTTSALVRAVPQACVRRA